MMYLRQLQTAFRWYNVLVIPRKSKELLMNEVVETQLYVYTAFSSFDDAHIKFVFYDVCNKAPSVNNHTAETHPNCLMEKF